MSPSVKFGFQRFIEEDSVEFVADAFVLRDILVQPLGVTLDVIEQPLIDISENRGNSL